MKNKEIRVLQLIDSLSIGGAERVSVNYANAISEIKNYKSYHCTTREEGMLSSFLLTNVNRFFMDKKSVIDIGSYFRLIRYIKNHKITIVHAHSSSFFTAIIIKLFTGIKIVWHDHYGNSENIQGRSFFALKIGSFFFSHILSVNNILKEWAIKELYVNKSKIKYIPNYAELFFTNKNTVLPGKDKKRIVLLANLRPQKDHMNILKAFNIIIKNSDYSDWHLLIVGRDWKDKYSNDIKEYINKNKMVDNVSILGGRSDIAEILNQSDIGVISSLSEGLPVALLEYGLASLATISTDVGECANVLNKGEVGIIVDSNNHKQLSDAIKLLIKSEELRTKLGKKFNVYIQKNYSKDSIIKNMINIYSEL